MRHMPCFAHTLDLVVKKALEVIPEIHNIRTQTRRIVAFLKSSTNAKERLSVIPSCTRGNEKRTVSFYTSLLVF